MVVIIFGQTLIIRKSIKLKKDGTFKKSVVVGISGQPLMILKKSIVKQKGTFGKISVVVGIFRPHVNNPEKRQKSNKRGRLKKSVVLGISGQTLIIRQKR